MPFKIFNHVLINACLFIIETLVLLYFNFKPINGINNGSNIDICKKPLMCPSADDRHFVAGSDGAAGPDDCYLYQ